MRGPWRCWLPVHGAHLAGEDGGELKGAGEGGRAHGLLVHGLHASDLCAHPRVGLGLSGPFAGMEKHEKRREPKKPLRE